MIALDRVGVGVLERGDEPGPRHARREELEPGEGVEDLAELVARDGDLEVLVLAPLPAEAEVDRPAGGDVPRRLDLSEQPRGLLGPPGIPLGHVGLERRGNGQRCRPSGAAEPCERLRREAVERPDGQLEVLRLRVLQPRV